MPGLGHFQGARNIGMHIVFEILEIQGSYVNESYNLRLDLRDGETGRILGSDAKECEICSARDFYRAVKDRCDRY